MELTLTVLRCPDSVVPEQRRVPGGDYRIGRGADCDWVLPDPDRLLSKQHCVLEFRSGGWEVRDTSTNGTFVNHASAPVGREQSAVLNDGDRIRLGAYEIEIRVEQAAAGSWQGASAMPMAPAAPGWDDPPPPRPEWDAEPPPRQVGEAWQVSGWEQAAQPTRQQDPLAPRVAGDPFAMPGLEPPAASYGGGPGGMQGGGGLPGADPFASPAADPFANEAMPDHRPSTSDAFLPPRAMQQVSAIPDDWDLDLSPKPAQNQGPPPPAPAPPPGAIPDDWDFDLSPKPVQKQAPPPRPVVPPPDAPPRAPSPGALPADFSLAPEPMAPPVAPVPPIAPPATTQFVADETDPFHEEVPAAQRAALPPAPVVVAAVPPAPVPVAPAPVAAPMPPPAAAMPNAGGGDAAAGLAAFLAGAGLPPQPLRASAEETLQALGAAFAAAVAGMRALLIARADVKREFRIEQTMLRAGANNPVKFAATDEAAMAGLIAAGAQQGPAALAETIADLTAHQVATLAATQAAARALLDKLAPAVLESGEQSGGGLFGASREKKLWDAYKKLHQQVSDQFDDDFDSAFGKEFARAYEQASKR
jgi:type VI secretion system protein ImpI/type VI secretion system protein